ncbi:MAG TPA: FecR domain-containing protein [Polyangiaceae bacterium]|nr:FecR domain-containing protein [Polyangiaceae bacterium]
MGEAGFDDAERTSWCDATERAGGPAGNTREQRAQWIQRQAAELLGLAGRLLGPHVGAREVVRDTFVAAFSSRESEAGASFAVITRNLLVELVLERLEERRFLGFGARVLRPKFAALGPRLLPESSEGVRAELARFYEALLLLSPRTRVAFLLHEVEGLATAQIASSLRAAPLRVERWLQRADRHIARSCPAGAPSLQRLYSPLSSLELRHLTAQVESELGKMREQHPDLARSRRSRYVAGGAALGLIVPALWALGVPQSLTRDGRGRATTGVGALHTAPSLTQADVQKLELPGGAQATLSATSQLKIEAAESGRVQLTLLSGQADFVIQHPRQQNFVVHAPGAALTAAAERFSVALERDRLNVHVQRGHVHVQPAGDDRTLNLGSGETWSGPRERPRREPLEPPRAHP